MGASSSESGAWEFWIDVGGTFTDCLARCPEGALQRQKLLSSGQVPGSIRLPAPDGFLAADAGHLPDQFWQGSRLVIDPPGKEPLFESRVVHFSGQEGRFELADPLPSWAQPGTPYRLLPGLDAPLLAIHMVLGRLPADPLPDCSVRLGTTRGTNALVTRRGAVTALVTTRGLGDLLLIGNQDRPRLFDLEARKKNPLFCSVVEIDERLSASGDVLVPLDEKQARDQLARLRKDGIESLAICLLHAYRNDQHEQQLGEIARQLGFRHVSLSSVVAPLIKIVSRGDTTVVNAYLDPVLVDYVGRIQAGLSSSSRLRLLTSAGGLVSPAAFMGKDSVLSGPAGGVVGYAGVARAAGFSRAIGFDMGGTSTDVSRFDGRFEYEYETEKAGIRLVTPMMAIQTVAAGGGSLCQFDGVKLIVGPGSAGAEPGPACYGRGGPLALTDANLLLGRIRPEQFPLPLDEQAALEQVSGLIERIEQATGKCYQPRELADAFVRIANSNMAEAIRSVSVARGYDPAQYLLVAFGGAAGQHACELARQLGIRQILNHPDAGILSALGIGLADVQRHVERGIYKPADQIDRDTLAAVIQELRDQARDQVLQEGVPVGEVTTRLSIDLRYLGMDGGLTITEPNGKEAEDWLDPYLAGFQEHHLSQYGYLHRQRALEVVAVRVEATGSAGPQASPDVGNADLPAGRIRPARKHGPVWFQGEELDSGIFRRADLQAGDRILGPAVILETLATTVIDPGWQAEVRASGELILEDTTPSTTLAVGLERATGEKADPAALEIYNNRFAGIARQMGITLRSTSASVNVKERLDFSCALFTASGELVVNAPHIPVHLGAMGETVRALLSDNPSLAPGDVLVTNDPYRGGSHLPDITVVTPVFASVDGEPEQLVFLLANRAHHAEIGGITPGSMPPFSRSLAEEGVLIRNFFLLRKGEWQGQQMRTLLAAGPHPTRSIEDNMADLQAQVAANHQGQQDLLALLEQQGCPEVLYYMNEIQQAAERKMRMALERLKDGVYPFEDFLDDGSRIAVTVTIQGEQAVIDFEGSSDVVPGNLNANRAIVTAAVMYVLRCLVDEDIPLNEGVLAPVEIRLPAGMLNPPAGNNPADCPAVVGGNVETSQRIVDVLLGALQMAAASQGTMNNLMFGDETFGYYETICGGAGATSGAAGEDAVHTHMTNTRITDAEVLEQRYPVRLREFSIRQGSGGEGQFSGGDGVLRRIEFLSELDVSILSQRRGEYPPFGIQGGKAGKVGVNEVQKADGSLHQLEGAENFTVAPGDLLTIQTPGGGGWGISQGSKD